MSDMIFHCSVCKQKFVVDKRGMGLTIQCTTCQTNITIPKKSNTKNIIITIISIVMLLIGIVVGKEIVDNWELEDAYNKCENKSSFDIKVKYVDNKNIVVFDIKTLDEYNVRKVDALHILFQFGHKIDDFPYKRIVLSIRENWIYQMTKSDMNELSYEYTYGNKIYSIRKWPSVLYDIHGNKLFNNWQGGILGVMSKEMEDCNVALDRWLKF